MGDRHAVVDIATSQQSSAYSADVFGHFIEHFHRQVYGGIFDPGSPLSDHRGFRQDVIEAVRDLAPSVVRWPGGCFVSDYHWLNGVGPQRRPHYDKAWRVTDPNSFGTREFVEWCRAIGAAPYICTNAGTGTAEEMSDWVEYCNLAAGAGRWSDLRQEHGDVDPLTVPYWSIGNENYGSWEIGAKTPDEWANLVRESAKMIRRVDPSVRLLTAARADLDWTLPLLQAAGPYVDMVSIHGYWDRLAQVDAPIDYLTAMSRSLQPQDDIQRTADIIGAAGYAGQIGIAFDEWNLRGWHHPDGTSAAAIAARDRNDDNSTYTMADAIFSASFLNACLRRSDVVKMANIAPTINTRGPLFVHPDGIVKRSTYHVLWMYAQLLGKRVLTSAAGSPELTSAGVPVIDQLATVDESGRRISLVLINKSPDAAVGCEVRIAGHRLDGVHAATVLDAPSTDSYNDIDHPDLVVPRTDKINFVDGRVLLAPHSVTVCQIDLPLPYPAGETDEVGLDGPWQLGLTGWSRNG
ncbi:alpha-L-arabinofuranosidase C-terminal domain-containing protein [Microlunatus soli]|uniref:non-reducing end alpha-L-arabinofuranosidase n=1 Tax=Microlunatus soli TaxID=630515 RepID=A0A1H1YZK8_9ACTN|nr:alpha-L-arabinofuranosidase C-terminal domain-containing protein [Microlunatus soli]SDT26843.1 alpha-N-arabinofuranosidase [Microlunatus soli]